jgi:short-subunit dehydrogenase
MSLASGKVLLTGATGGLGHAIARALASRGAELTLTGRRVDVLEPLAAELGARAIACDLGDREELDRLVASVGTIDVLVANAGMPGTGVLTELTQQQIDRMLEVNLRAPIALAHAFAPGMVERRRGHMVFISSLNGKAATPATSIYSAAKFGLRGFAQGIRADLRPHGVGVSTVLPGFISDAGMFADTGLKLPFGVGTKTPEQVAAAVLKAIDHNRAEIDVAPLPLRAGTAIAQVAPELAATVKRLAGSDKLAGEFADRQRDKIASQFNGSDQS